jgi:histidinol phosphatase-like PHP family hydrolase
MTIDGDKVETKRHELVMPKELQLIDNHIHSELAYCSQDMTVEKTIALAQDFGLAGVTFTEHSGQLYFDRKPYWRNVWMEAGIEGAEEEHNRMSAYLELKQKYESEFARFSLEVECDVRGKLLLKADDRQQFDQLMGTIHCLPGLTKEAPPEQRDSDDFLFLVDAMGKQGIRALAHPLRIFRRAGWDTPTELFDPTAKLLRKHQIAAEINYHTNEPPVDFIRCCLKEGVEFSFGSDAHNLAEIGDFAYHIDLLRRAGFDGDLADVLIKP